MRSPAGSDGDRRGGRRRHRGRTTRGRRGSGGCGRPRSRRWATVSAMISRHRRAVMLPMRDSRDTSTVRHPLAPSVTVGPGVSSAIGKTISEATMIGVVGWPSRTVSRKPCSAGRNARSRIESKLITLTPTLRLMKSAASSRMVRGDVLVEVAAPAQPEVEEIDVGAERDDRRPGGGGRECLCAVADRAAVMHPARAGRRRGATPRPRRRRPLGGRGARRSRCAGATPRSASVPGAGRRSAAAPAHPRSARSGCA